MLKRILNLNLPAGQSVFVWGARQTGKSSYLQAHFKTSAYIDLLDTHQFIRLARAPYLLREMLLALPARQRNQPIIIDEVQKVPELLNEVHWLIENAGLAFILCGSSARQLKTQSTNLLGGRAWTYGFYPLVTPEVHDFNLQRALNHGLLPRHYLAEAVHRFEHLQAYVDTYLADEIRSEGLVRNLGGFARFLDVVGLCNGELINMQNIARDCSIARATVAGYFQILQDTLLGYFVQPYARKVKRDLITAAPKFYLFDVGVANYLAKREVLALKGAEAGRSFEHFILMELWAYLGLKRKRSEIRYWRTKTGLEVDFILGAAQTALEVKISAQVHQQDLRGLIAFCQEHPTCQALVVSQDPKPRKLVLPQGLSIDILPWRVFLARLWAGQIAV